VIERRGAAPLGTIGALFAGRALLLTYPELDIYPERGPSDYYGITDTGEGSALPDWPEAPGARVFAYVYHYYPRLEPLFAALERLGFPAIVFCRGLPPELRSRYAGGPLAFPTEPASVSRLLPGADFVISHGSHQMTAQALLAGKPLLMLPTQLEQFLIMRRVVRYGAGLGVAQDAPEPDFPAALAELAGDRGYGAKAREFAQRYAGHSRRAALETMIARCESALAAVRS
jgi:hypothetical protein